MSISPYPLRPEPMNKSWIERHPLWKIPLGFLTLVLLMGLFAVGLISLISETFHHSDVYQQAMARAAANMLVHEQIGDPVHADWIIVGDLKLNGSAGYANFSIPISGPRGKGRIRVVASKSGVWRFTYLQVYVDGQSNSIDLLSIQPPADPTS